MTTDNEIRADHDADTLVVYQAYAPAIADAALKAGRFVPPFSLQRMTWIKPSFLWLMHRSQWGQKAGQERILRVRITRAGWDRALSLGVLTSFERGVFASSEDWAAQFEGAPVHVQWDPERSLRGAGLPHNSIQVGLSRHVIQDYTERWTVGIEDCTPLVRKIHALLRAGETAKAKKLLPPERVYPVTGETARRLGITGG